MAFSLLFSRLTRPDDTLTKRGRYGNKKSLYRLQDACDGGTMPPASAPTRTS
jgi:hypothetical protein